MKVLVVGCGSIGGRHIANLLKISGIEEIFVYTKRKNCLNNINDRKNKIRIVKNLNKLKVDFAIICNETYKHIKTAITLAKEGVHLFIEKPISNKLNGIDELKRIIKEKKIILFVAYNLRFIGSLKYIKKYLSHKHLGDLYFAKIEVGQYLPHWRGNIDYKKSYSASKRKGGGVALDLSHEIDYMQYLFGFPIYWKTFKTKVSKLKINTEDVFEGLYLFKNNFICNVHSDYLQRPIRRIMRIVGDKGILICDFIKKYIVIKNHDKEIIINRKGLFDMEKTYMDEMNHFINAIRKNRKSHIDLDEGIKVLRLLEDKNV